jgi:hypothetical protein
MNRSYLTKMNTSHLFQTLVQKTVIKSEIDRDRLHMVLQEDSCSRWHKRRCQPCRQCRVRWCPGRSPCWGRSRRDAISSRAEALPKNLIAPHPYMFTRGAFLRLTVLSSGARRRGYGEGVAATQGQRDGCVAAGLGLRLSCLYSAGRVRRRTQPMSELVTAYDPKRPEIADRKIIRATIFRNNKR